MFCLEEIPVGGTGKRGEKTGPICEKGGDTVWVPWNLLCRGKKSKSKGGIQKCPLAGGGGVNKGEKGLAIHRRRPMVIGAKRISETNYNQLGLRQISQAQWGKGV